MTDARRVLESLPAGTRGHLESLGAWIPRELLYGSTFRRTRAALRRSQWWSAERHRAALEGRIAELVAYCYREVPYYRRLFDDLGLRPDEVRSPADLTRLPTLDKETVRARLDELVARSVPPAARELVSTGGTSGEPLRVWLDRDRSSVEWAFMTLQWERVGYRLGARRAVLRGWSPPEPSRALWEAHPLLDEIVLSTFHLTGDSLVGYAETMRGFGVEFLQAYPSSAESLCRLLAAHPGVAPPRLRAVLVSSEILYPPQRRFIEATLGVRVFDYYGQSEKALMGAGCEDSNDFHFFPEYGHLEVLDDADRPVPPGGSGTIVGTSFVNRVTPLLRYRTDDLGTVATGACGCGRAYPRLTAIEGRWRQEWIVGRAGQRFSMTALNTHADAFHGIHRFQIRQERPGEASLLVVPGAGFTPETPGRAAAEYQRRTGGEVRFHPEVVDSIPLTARGKFRFVDQRIPTAAPDATPAGGLRGAEA